MSEPVKTREQELKEQYFQKCAQAGELGYKMIQFEDDLRSLQDDIAALNKEYHQLLVDKEKETANVPPTEKL